MNSADDVDDGIKGADFMKMDLVGGRPVNCTLHFTESRKQRLRTRLTGRTQSRALNERVDLRQRSVRVRLGCHPAMGVMVMSTARILAADLELCRLDSCALHTFGPDCIA